MYRTIVRFIVLLTVLFASLGGGMAPSSAQPETTSEDPPAWFEGSGWQPVWLAPGGEDGDLLAVDTVAPDLIVAVGASGLIYRSEDGGDSWSLQWVDAKIALRGVHMFDETTGIVVGDEGHIYRTTRHGRRWDAVPSGTGEDLNAITFVDENRGWIVGQGGTILYTEDGGQTWTRQNADVTAGLKAVSFADAQHGWAVGANGTILHTTDGGATWSRQDGGTHVELTGVLALTPEEAWIVGREGVVRHTVDGGTTWTVHDLTPRMALFAVTADPRGNVWIASNGGYVYGQTAEHTFRPFTIEAFGARLNQPVYALAFLSEETLIAVGGSSSSGGLPKGMLLARSRDRGATWDLPAGQGVFQWQDISLASDTHMWVVGQAADGGGAILTSSDGGKTWSARVIDVPLNPRRTTQFMDVDFADETHGIIVGRRSQIVDTHDGGTTWRWRSLRDITRVEETWLYTVRYLPDGNIWTSGEFGQVFHSPDNGETWRHFNLSWTGLNVVSSRVYINAMPGGYVWGVSNTGIMVSSRDNGTSWFRDSEPLRRPDGRSPHLRATYFLDDQEGWVVGYLGSIWHTKNGGRRSADWEFIPVPEALSRVAWHDVYFFDTYHGILVGGECPVYECSFTTDFTRAAVAVTSDGGRTWEYEFLPDIRILYGIDARSPDHVFAVGDHGAILRYTGFPNHMDVFKLAEPLTIDGNPGDWPTGPSVSLDATSADYVDADTPPPATDLSARVQAFWDEGTLYVSALITDDIVTSEDAFILGLDADRSKDLSPGDHAFRITSQGEVSEKGLPVPQVQVGVRPREGGYTVELGIPASLLADHLRPWSTLGFTLALEDDDGAGVDTVLVSDGRDPSRPSADFGTLTLYDDHLTIRRDANVYSHLADAYIYRSRPNDNFGEFDEVPPYRRLRLGWDRNKGWETRSILVGFDVRFLPPDTRIENARLFLRSRYRVPSSLRLRVAAYGLLKPWEETEVTWNEARKGVPWDAPGANRESGDRDAEPSDVQAVDSFPAWIAWDVTDIVQRMLAGNAWGVLLRPEEGTATGVFTFISSEEEQARDEIPYVEMTYALHPRPLPTPTPTPTATPTPTPSPTPTPTATPIPSYRIYIPAVHY